MTDLFVSYKRENLAAVGRLVEALRAERIGVWWDQDIPPNAAWEATIERELAAAKLVIVAWSPAAVASDNVKAEARWARGQGRLLQVFVESCDPPLFFGERQGVDLQGWSGAASEAAFRTILAAVREGLLPSSPAPDAAVPTEPPPLPRKPSIAVLPFANLSGDPEQDYFADGMVEEIVAALTRVRSIFVIASGSGLSFRGKGVTAQDAARELGVRYVLEGSVRKAGGRVRVAVKLMDASDGTQTWADRFEDTLEDVFALQDRVALAVAGKIEPTVREAEVRRASARPTDNLSSYDLYLRAIPLQRTLVRADTLEALDPASRAITLDPDFGPALALAATCHRIIVVNGWSDDLEGHRRLGLELAHRALKAAGDDADVLARVAASFEILDGDHGAAVSLLERALTLNPGCATAWFFRGFVRVRAGETDAAIEDLRTALRQDPLGPLQPAAIGNIGRALFQQGRFSEAVPLLKEQAQHVDAPLPQAFLAAAYGHLAQLSEARAALARYRARSPQTLEAFAAIWLRDPAQRKLFLDGIALAEGKSASETPASAG
jgi:adenylate cyclase